MVNTILVKEPLLQVGMLKHNVVAALEALGILHVKTGDTRDDVVSFSFAKGPDVRHPLSGTPCHLEGDEDCVSMAYGSEGHVGTDRSVLPWADLEAEDGVEFTLEMKSGTPFVVTLKNGQVDSLTHGGTKLVNPAVRQTCQAQ